MKVTRAEMKAARLPLECAQLPRMRTTHAWPFHAPTPEPWPFTCVALGGAWGGRVAPHATRLTPLPTPVLCCLPASARLAPYRLYAPYHALLLCRWRDYCAHILIPLNKCRIDHYWLPWTCMDLKHAYEKCQFDEYARRTLVVGPANARTDPSSSRRTSSANTP